MQGLLWRSLRSPERFYLICLLRQRKENMKKKLLTKLASVRQHYPLWADSEQLEYAKQLVELDLFLCDECGAEYSPIFDYGNLDLCWQCEKKAMVNDIDLWQTKEAGLR